MKLIIETSGSRGSSKYKCPRCEYFGACRVAKRTGGQKFSEKGETWQKNKIRGTDRDQII